MTGIISKVFTNNPFDSTSIAGNTITSLFEDSRGWLRFGVRDEGVDVYDPKTGRFLHFPFHFDEEKSPLLAQYQTKGSIPKA